MNSFETVVIGTQTWAKRNYDFGGSYPDSDIANVAVYGKLYTWAEAQAINYPGWHLPSRTECQALITYVGGETVAGGHLKEAGTTHWSSPNVGADNSSGFTALPTEPSGTTSMFWTSTDAGTGGWVIFMDASTDNGDAGTTTDYSTLCYVRLIKD